MSPAGLDGPLTDSPRRHPPLLHPVGGVRRQPLDPRRPAAARATRSTATAGRTTRSSAARTASTAPGRARGRSTSRTASSPGRRSRPTTRRPAPTARSTSPADARAVPPSAGTPTRPPGFATPTCAACCSRCTARPSAPSAATRSSPGPSVVQDPEKAKRYKSARGKGGLVRSTWEEVVEIIAAAHVYTIKRWGPDRIAGFSPIPAMSPVSYASGARFLELIGAPMLSFYDWYADLPNASPQMFGDQTDVPESGDWWDAGYLIMWGSNVPDDAHARRALDDRGALPRPEGRRGLARLRRERQVRRRVGRLRPRHRRRPRDGDGARHPQGVLRRPAGRLLHRLQPEVHRPALPRRARARHDGCRVGRRRRRPRLPAGQVPRGR